LVVGPHSGPRRLEQGSSNRASWRGACSDGQGATTASAWAGVRAQDSDLLAEAARKPQLVGGAKAAAAAPPESAATQSLGRGKELKRISQA